MTDHTCEFIEVLYTYGGDVVARRCPRCLAICSVCPTCARYPMPTDKRRKCECQRKASRVGWHYPRITCACGCGAKFTQQCRTHKFAESACGKRFYRRQKREAKR